MKPRKPLTPAQAAEAEKLRLEWAAEVDWLAGAIQAQREALEKPARVFNQTWVDEHGEKRYDWEIIGTGMSRREWDAANAPPLA